MGAPADGSGCSLTTSTGGEPSIEYEITLQFDSPLQEDQRRDFCVAISGSRWPACGSFHQLPFKSNQPTDLVAAAIQAPDVGKVEAVSLQCAGRAPAMKLLQILVVKIHSGEVFQFGGRHFTTSSSCTTFSGPISAGTGPAQRYRITLHGDGPFFGGEDGSCPASRAVVLGGLDGILMKAHLPPLPPSPPAALAACTFELVTSTTGWTWISLQWCRNGAAATRLETVMLQQVDPEGSNYTWEPAGHLTSGKPLILLTARASVSHRPGSGPQLPEEHLPRTAAACISPAAASNLEDAAGLARKPVPSTLPVVTTWGPGDPASEMCRWQQEAESAAATLQSEAIQATAVEAVCLSEQESDAVEGCHEQLASHRIEDYEEESDGEAQSDEDERLLFAGNEQPVFSDTTAPRTEAPSDRDSATPQAAAVLVPEEVLPSGQQLLATEGRCKAAEETGLEGEEAEVAEEEAGEKVARRVEQQGLGDADAAVPEKVHAGGDVLRVRLLEVLNLQPSPECVQAAAQHPHSLARELLRPSRSYGGSAAPASWTPRTCRPYVVLTIRDQVHRAKAAESVLQTRWDEEFTFQRVQPQDQLLIQVYSQAEFKKRQNARRDVRLGEAAVRLASFVVDMSNPHVPTRRCLTFVLAGCSQGQVTLDLSWMPDGLEPPPLEQWSARCIEDRQRLASLPQPSGGLLPTDTELLAAVATVPPSAASHIIVGMLPGDGCLPARAEPSSSEEGAPWDVEVAGPAAGEGCDPELAADAEIPAVGAGQHAGEAGAGFAAGSSLPLTTDAQRSKAQLQDEAAERDSRADNTQQGAVARYNYERTNASRGKPTPRDLLAAAEGHAGQMVPGNMAGREGAFDTAVLEGPQAAVVASEGSSNTGETAGGGSALGVAVVVSNAATLGEELLGVDDVDEYGEYNDDDYGLEEFDSGPIDGNSNAASDGEERQSQQAERGAADVDGGSSGAAGPEELSQGPAEGEYPVLGERQDGMHEFGDADQLLDERSGAADEAVVLAAVDSPQPGQAAGKAAGPTPATSPAASAATVHAPSPAHPVTGRTLPDMAVCAIEENAWADALEMTGHALAMEQSLNVSGPVNAQGKSWRTHHTNPLQHLSSADADVLGSPATVVAAQHGHDGDIGMCKEPTPEMQDGGEFFVANPLFVQSRTGSSLWASANSPPSQPVIRPMDAADARPLSQKRPLPQSGRIISLLTDTDPADSLQLTSPSASEASPVPGTGPMQASLQQTRQQKRSLKESGLNGEDNLPSAAAAMVGLDGVFDVSPRSDLVDMAGVGNGDTFWRTDCYDKAAVLQRHFPQVADKDDRYLVIMEVGGLGRRDVKVELKPDREVIIRIRRRVMSKLQSLFGVMEMLNTSRQEDESKGYRITVHLPGAVNTTKRVRKSWHSSTLVVEVEKLQPEGS